MNFLNKLNAGLQSLFSKHRVDRELEEELESYLDASTADKQRSGLSPKAARHAALAEMGSRSSVKHRVWTSRWESTMDNLLKDLRFSFRALLKSPGFTLVALLSLALGIGANTAIFTLLNAILLRPLPVQNPQQLVLFGHGRAAGSSDDLPNESTELFSYPFYREFKGKTQAYSGVAAQSSIQFATHVSIGGSAVELLHIDLVSGNYFSILGVPPALGRTLSEADDKAPGAGPVAVVSYAWFQRHFGGNPAALGKTIRILSHDYTLVGVAQPGFTGIAADQPTDFWIPLSMQKEISPAWNGLDRINFQSLYLFARLKPNVAWDRANAETNFLFKQILRSDFVGKNPSQKELSSIQHAQIELTSAARGVSRLRRLVSIPLKILMGIVGMVLLIACANIANMLLARGVARAREVAVRMALGASRARIVLQLLTESALLAFAGATLGVGLAWKASTMLLRMATPGPEPIPLDLAPDLPVLSFTLLLTVLTALLFGIMPALRATSLELSPALKEGRGGGTASTRGVLARGLIVGQIALSILLLAVAGLFLRSLNHLNNADTGFEKKNVLIFFMDEYAANLPADSRLLQLQQQIESRVKALPGVKAASFSMFSFDQGVWSSPITVQGVPITGENSHEALFNVVGPDFFSTFNLPILSGRGFTSRDTEKSTPVAVINQTMERRFFPNGSAVGHHFGRGLDQAGSGEYEIIGVVKDAKYSTLGEKQEMAAYHPYSQNVQYFSNFSVRYSGDPASVISAVRHAISEVNPEILVSNVTTLEDQVDGSVSTQRLIAQLSAFFGALAVFLACIGTYGLISYSVVRRTNEIGIRLALGAQTGTLLWMVLRESLLLLAIGLAIGLPITLASTGVLRQQLYELSPVDPYALTAAVVIVAIMTLMAAWLPARRAAKVDPMIALRCD